MKQTGLSTFATSSLNRILHYFELKRCDASLTKHMLSDPRRIGKIEIDMELDDIYSDKEKLILEAAAKTCPVALSLHPDLIQDLTIRYV